jgi:hypothetical protein
MRLELRLLLVACGTTVGCWPPLDDLRGAAPYCDSRGSDVEHCADFDEVAAPQDGWDDFNDDPSARLSLDDQSGVSPPASLLAEVLPGNEGCAYAMLRADIEGQTPRFAFGFDLQVGEEAHRYFGAVSWTVGGTDCRTVVFVDQTRVGLLAQTAGDVSEGLEFDLQTEVGQAWSRLDVEVDLEPGAGEPSFVLRWGEERFERQLDGDSAWLGCGTVPDADSITLGVGPYCVPQDVGSSARFDNVIFDL